MKLKYILFSLIIITSCKQEPLERIAEQAFHYNHEIFEENKLAPRATFFASESNDIIGKEDSKRFISLNGDWKCYGMVPS